MSSSSSTVLRSKEAMVKTQPSDIICPCGGQTVYKQSETKANPGRWYLRCIGGCGFLRWADVGEDQGCPICREVMPALIQSIKDKDELAKCKDQLAQYKNDDVFKLKMYLGITWVLIVLVYLLK
ncbi:putative transcription factor GRF family [Helianthus annuus]|nr:putative transcription factor GRF family [Helianthus annuus]KAJ0820136.1 putative transcription factor GRF family [Helianthus annuus]KAJ0834704.1 putative transcription factor GRF family [Helianthus annuus]